MFMVPSSTHLLSMEVTFWNPSPPDCFDGLAKLLLKLLRIFLALFADHCRAKTAALIISKTFFWLLSNAF